MSHLEGVLSLAEDGAVGERTAHSVYSARLMDIHVCAGHVDVVPAM